MFFMLTIIINIVRLNEDNKSYTHIYEEQFNFKLGTNNFEFEYENGNYEMFAGYYLK